MSEQVLPRTESILGDGLSAGLHVGVQACVLREGRMVAQLAIGESRPAVAMADDTIMLWMSACKPFAAVALAQLREQGRIEFDDPIALYVPEFASKGKDDITLRHVLTHTAPIRSVEVGWPEASWEQIIATLAEQEPEADWPLGEKAGYSPFSSWFLLAEVVRRVDGRPYEDYLRDEILLPLGMSDSWMAMPPREYRAYGERIGIMMNTSRKPPIPTGNDTEHAAAACRPSGGARGPARELARFYSRLLEEGKPSGDCGLRISDCGLKTGATDPNARDEPSSNPQSALRNPQFRLLSPASIRLLTFPHRVGLYDHTFRHTMDWGLGFMVNSAKYGVDTVPYGFGPYASEAAFGHGGSQSCAAFADPAHGLAVAIIFNGMPGEPAHQRRLRATLAALYEDLGLASSLAG